MKQRITRRWKILRSRRYPGDKRIVICDSFTLQEALWDLEAHLEAQGYGHESEYEIIDLRRGHIFRRADDGEFIRIN